MKRNVTAKKAQHVMPLGTGWAVKGEGSVNFSIITISKKDAVAYAKQVAASNNTEIFIHKKDGSIDSRNRQARKHESVNG